MKKKTKVVWQKGTITCKDWRVFRKDKPGSDSSITLENEEAYFIESESIPWRSDRNSGDGETHIRYLFYLPNHEMKYVRLGDIKVFTPDL